MDSVDAAAGIEINDSGAALDVTKKSKRGGKFMRTFIAGFIVLLIILVPVQFLVAGMLGKPVISESEVLTEEITIPQGDPEDPNYLMFRDSQRMNILLLGLNHGLTDTIMLGSYDMENQKVDVISIPRDTYFDRPEAKDGTQRKINAIYYKGGALGTAKAVSTVLMGMPIHYYVVVDYKAVEEVVDSINGVPVNIPFNMIYDDPYDKPVALHINFKKGEQVLMGADAVKFLRFRKNNRSVGGGYPEGDVGRITAQQEFMKAALKKSVGLNLPKVVDKIMQNVETDLKIGVAGKLAINAAKLDMGNITTYLTPGEAHTRDRLSYWFINEEEIEKMVKGIYMPETLLTSGAAIEGAPEESAEDGNRALE
ncbi:MAG: LCP family protein [Clostridiales Family XIII bacterium]|jgi:LCP family protein required for cell wall assembly|nr:LCP family protein [Clostridiales Family XIII bacterium]